MTEQIQSQIVDQRIRDVSAEFRTLCLEVEERDQAIRQIHSDMLDLNQLMLDMAQLVKDQTLTIDNIESHIEEAVFATDQGVVELRQANENHKSSCIIS